MAVDAHLRRHTDGEGDFGSVSADVRPPRRRVLDELSRRQQPPRGDWVHAFIAQRGTIPAGTGELRLLSTSFEFQVLIDGVFMSGTFYDFSGLLPCLRRRPYHVHHTGA